MCGSQQGWNKQWDEWVEQDGLHKFKKELLDVRLDGGENSAQGTADARCSIPPALPSGMRSLQPDLVYME